MADKKDDRPKSLTRLERIRILEQQLQDIESLWSEKKEEVKEIKSEWEAKLAGLRREITGNPNQEDIFDPSDNEAPEDE